MSSSMEHMAEILKRAQIVRGTGIPDTPRAPVCSICGGAGYLRYDVPVDDPRFGELVVCECTKQELAQKQVADNQAYREFLRRRGMSAGLYMLPTGGQDHQHPHAADEMYFVLRGQATLRVGDREHPVRPGSVVSVDHGEEHQFVDITEDLRVLVVFAPPEGSLQGSRN